MRLITPLLGAGHPHRPRFARPLPPEGRECLGSDFADAQRVTLERRVRTPLACVVRTVQHPRRQDRQSRRCPEGANRRPRWWTSPRRPSRSMSARWLRRACGAARSAVRRATATARRQLARRRPMMMRRAAPRPGEASVSCLFGRRTQTEVPGGVGGGRLRLQEGRLSPRWLRSRRHQ